MAAIDLPSSPSPQAAVPRLLDWGADLAPSLGGAIQRIQRLGSRHAIDVVMPPMSYVDGMKWVQRLKRSKSSRVRMEFPQPGFTPVGGDGATAGTVSGGTSLNVTGLTALAALKEGQFFSHLRGGKHYLYSLDADVTVSGIGGAIITFTPMLRTAFTNGSDTLQFSTPQIEGILLGDELSWDLNTARHVGLSFSIMEAE